MRAPVCSACRQALASLRAIAHHNVCVAATGERSYERAYRAELALPPAPPRWHYDDDGAVVIAGRGRAA